MKFNSSCAARWQVIVLCTAAALVQAAPLETSAPVNVSSTLTATEKAKMARLAYVDAGVFRKPWLSTYADGPAGRQNVYARVSFDDGATWQPPVLLSRDGAGAPTGGQSVSTVGGTFAADNSMPMLFAPTVTSGPQVSIAWDSAYCPPDPAAGTSGSYRSEVQGVSTRVFHCVWVATSTDPSLARWSVHQLTTAQRDATNEAIAGNATGAGLALVWQEDPAGLQPGEAEGPGDGDSGSRVTGGTNIWYAYAPRPHGATLRANVRQLTNNNQLGSGYAGASRPNLAFSGQTAVVAYEESACSTGTPGDAAAGTDSGMSAKGGEGKCIVYHVFPFATPDTDSAGTAVSAAGQSARRVRIVVQGQAAAGPSPLRALLLWRESARGTRNAPADIVIRRGLAQPGLRPGSTGLAPADILADAPQYITRVAATGGNANAHRAVMRGGSIVIAYDLTADMAGADPARTAFPSATYNLFVTRSSADGAPGTWSVPVDLSGLTTADTRVVEPRLVPTPGTIVNPLTGVPDAGDLQDANVLFAAFATEPVTPGAGPARVLVSRSTDGGARFAPFVPIVPSGPAQSESQLRPSPDGAAVAVLWMGEQVPGDPQSKDAMFARAVAPLPDLAILSTPVTLPAGGGHASLRLDIVNKGPGDARQVTLAGTVSPGLTLLGVTDAGLCQASGASFSCLVEELPAGASQPVTLAVSAAEAGPYSFEVTAASAASDAQTADNKLVVQLLTAAGAPVAEETADVSAAGGGCSSGPGGRFDPVLPALALLGFASAAVRRRNVFRERTNP